MNPPSPSTFQAFMVCPRQAWLMSRQMTADQENSYIDIGRLIDDTSFVREKKKIYIADLEAMIDMVTKKDGSYFIAEIKKSSNKLESGIFQLKYYLYLLKKKKGVDIKGIIKVPKEKLSETVELFPDDIVKIEGILIEIESLLKLEKAPVLDKKLSFCPRCGHYEFCWS